MSWRFYVRLDNGDEGCSKASEAQDDDEMVRAKDAMGDSVADPDGWLSIDTEDGGWLVMPNRRVVSVQLRREPV